MQCNWSKMIESIQLRARLYLTEQRQSAPIYPPYYMTGAGAANCRLAPNEADQQMCGAPAGAWIGGLSSRLDMLHTQKDGYNKQDFGAK